MTIIKNVLAISAETLYIHLKKDFTDYINYKLDSNLSTDFAHVYDVINVLFPEVIEGTALTITVTDDEITVSDNAKDSEFNTELLEKHLIDFITDRCS
ncbi:hypothetical protein SAMN05421821_12722 [Mucilaginibacter lappiensis]|uniref:Transglutaminase-like protease n=1 Tax=Mucilaginibacter lappiensis TaxID=354630 RepID=A0ABR6PTD5_9SPHI|nr:hypothetical protein [Mucilaginibacter lappiensis]MBB6113044.1 putative transglutaminase-like protease [Mucilaginibacter lappiensis]SIS11023.1 hypothetical protein SAMN05421821_12722 [Mucilaginibacter lappiensis]